jgi:hypothetical protein
MWTLLLALPLALDVLRAGAPLPDGPGGPGGPGTAGGATQVEALEPLDRPRPSAHPLSLGLFEARPSGPPVQWLDPLDGPPPAPLRDPTRDPLDLGWLFAPRPDPFPPGPRTTRPIDPYDFTVRAPVVEVRTSTWTDPYRERELYESLWELREKNGVNVRFSVGRSDCWWGPPR